LPDCSATRRARIIAHARSCASCETLLRHALGSRQRGQSQRQRWLGPQSAVDDPAASSQPAASPDVRGAAGSVVRKPPSRGRVPAWTRVALPLAAAVAAVIGTFAVVTTIPKPADLGDLESPPLPVTAVAGASRDAGRSAADSLVVEGLVAYERGDVAGAIARFESAHATGAFERLRLVFLASALLQANRVAEAQVILHGIDDRLYPQPYRGEILWMRADILARTGSKSAAESKLRVLAQRSGPASTRAIDRLRKSPAKR
jgi:hypothetical protein